MFAGADRVGGRRSETRTHAAMNPNHRDQDVNWRCASSSLPDGQTGSLPGLETTDHVGRTDMA
jgi:hypothetical protein